MMMQELSNIINAVFNRDPPGNAPYPFGFTLIPVTQFMAEKQCSTVHNVYDATQVLFSLVLIHS